MSELVILPEMLDAGVEALQECRFRKLGPEDTAVSVYLAMRAIEEIAAMRKKYEALH